jgi:MoxR-like ATPase
MNKEVETTRQIGPKQAISALKHCIDLQRPVMVWGAPGIGKSDIIKQIGDEAKREVIDIRLPLWEPTDIKGIPFYNSKSNLMEWAPPIELPSDPKSNSGRW